MSEGWPRPVLVVLCLALGLVAAASAVEWQGQLRLTYDDNLFEYSPADLALFRTSASPARFPIRTTDDLQADIGAGILARFRLAGRGGTVSLRTRLHGYFSNPEKSYGLATAEAGQTLWRTGRVSVTYVYLPRYLVRYFRNPASSDTADYAPCSFAEHLASVALRQRLGPFVVEPGYRYEIDGYARPYGYYNTRAHRAGTKLGWEPVGNLMLSGEYEYKLARAQGPVPDISFSQHELAVKVHTQPRRLDRFSLDAGYSYAHRTFTTANTGAVDPSHAGRVDIIEAIEVGARYRLAGPALVAAYEYEWRGVSSPYSSAISDVKDYRTHRFSLGVTVESRKAR